MENLAEVQTLSLALQGDWDGARKIAAIMEANTLQHLAATCERLYYIFNTPCLDRNIIKSLAPDAY